MPFTPDISPSPASRRLSLLRDAISFLFSSSRGLGNHLVARWLFLRSLGVIYFSAFFALLFQVRGLVGVHGILPAAQLLQQLRPAGATRIFEVPSLLWIHPTDSVLVGLCWFGLAASVLVTFNVAPRLSLLVSFVCFLSFIAVSQDFGQYQSDGMLLEAGFLALFLSPSGLLPGWGRRSPPIRAALLLLLFEWFRIYFQSGVVKLQSGDPTWRNLTAMYEYYQNGPLPTWIGYYLQHLPHWFQIATAGATLLLELGIVFMALRPRRWRIACFWIVTAWQAGVILTANYAFLNYLVLALGVLLLDDQYLSNLIPRRWRASFVTGHTDRPMRDTSPFAVRTWSPPFLRVAATTLTALALTWVAYSTTAQLLLMLAPRIPLPTRPIALLEPFRVANQYGLFATMTPHRYEIEFQGSNDGHTWTPYLFRYKPQILTERPRIYAPYQPRFDWNLWFASLGPWQQAPIVALTEERLLDGDADVLGLFRSEAFAKHPPRYVRAVLWQYWFTSLAEKRRTGGWWRRSLLGTYAPTLERLPDGQYGELAPADLEGPPLE